MLSDLLLIITCIAIALTLAYAAGRIFQIPSRLAALDIATVVKLTRNTLMAPVLVLTGLLYRRAMHQANTAAFSFGKLIPGFVLGFLLMSFVRAAGIAFGFLPQNISQPGDLPTAARVLKAIDEIAKFAILMALAGVGLNTSLQAMRQTGLKPFILGLCLALAALSLSLILLTGVGN